MRSHHLLLRDVLVHVTPDDLAKQLATDVREGLASRPRTLLPKYFYDARGSALFEDITRLPEYYPTRREREVLATAAAEVAELCGADTLVELGAGSSEKTRLLLDALRDGGTLRRYVPTDVSVSALVGAAAAVAMEYPEVEVQPVAHDFERHLHLLPTGGRRLVAFLGGTIGNLLPTARVGFLADLVATLAPGDALLLGADLVKDPVRLVAAYDDAAGVTAEFNRNVVAVLARELGATVAPADFDHVAVWDAENQWVEMRLRARRAFVLAVPAVDLTVEIEAGEEIRTEVSAKFTPERLDGELAAAGLVTRRRWTDAAGDFSLTLAAPS